MQPQITATVCDFSDRDVVRAATGSGESWIALISGLVKPAFQAGMRLMFPKGSFVQNFHF
jgi:hypothetical protein